MVHVAAAALGQRIRSARICASLQQSEVAAALSVAQTLVSRWERGVASVPAARLHEIAALLHVTDRWLLVGDGRGPSLLPMPRPRASRVDASGAA